MHRVNNVVEKCWQRALQIALFAAFLSFLADRELIRTAFGVWEDPTPARLVFFVSVAVLVVGMTRNTVRLQELVKLRSVPVSSEKPGPRPHDSAAAR